MNNHEEHTHEQSKDIIAESAVVPVVEMVETIVQQFEQFIDEFVEEIMEQTEPFIDESVEAPIDETVEAIVEQEIEEVRTEVEPEDSAIDHNT